MFVVLNGPLGIGKSTLAEALTESVDGWVRLDGDTLLAANPAPADEHAYLHETIVVLVAHHLRGGYRHFVIDYVWRTVEQLDDLRHHLRAVDPSATVHCFLLTLPLEENLRRIRRRQASREIDEREFELRVVHDERAVLERGSPDELGEPLDVSGPVSDVVARLLRRLSVR